MAELTIIARQQYRKMQTDIHTPRRIRISDPNMPAINETTEIDFV
jgi:hypothetical protein